MPVRSLTLSDRVRRRLRTGVAALLGLTTLVAVMQADLNDDVAAGAGAGRERRCRGARPDERDQDDDGAAQAQCGDDRHGRRHLAPRAPRGPGDHQGRHPHRPLQSLKTYRLKVQLAHNRFGLHRRVSYCAVQAGPQVSLSAWNNLYAWNRQPIAIYRGR